MDKRASETTHETVLRRETIDLLSVRDGGTYIDATLGLGGHTEEILLRSETAKVVGLDRDRSAIELAKRRLAKFGHRVLYAHCSFSNVSSKVREMGIGQVDGIVADLGVSSLQLDDAARGFSFRFDAPLDMRMDIDSDLPTAAELLEIMPQTEIADLIYQFGEERFSRRIAREILRAREGGNPVRTTKQLAELVERCVRRSPKEKTHPATRTFQALRIAVNRELEELERLLIEGIEILAPDGRFAVITFHSLEDRIVKQTFQRLSGKCFCPPRMPLCVCGSARKVEVVTRKPVIPERDETEQNPRSRSAKLRAVRRIADQS
ncbi:MAG TPA: 16S rRNA (cytosine(1402)-N(4))-methyltransferase RsmH [Pyrinomonadaceae bacterium]|nr:16S rRNA (cytosine(1402)-N(4))-methyltransferase RsmH [Pyrinomonadaceae bacterium]